METVLLKLLVTPALVTVATLAGRRFGQGVSGWLVAMPFTSGPVLLFIALERGTAFAAATAAGSIAGLIAGAAFGVAWARTAEHLPRASSGLAVGTVAFGATAALLALPSFPPGPFGAVALFVAAGLSFRAALTLVPRRGTVVAPPRAAAAWDLPARAAVATALVLSLTAAAPLVGPHLAGVLATYPVYASTLAYFAQRQDGPRGAVAVFRGLFAGLYTPALFCLALALLLEPAGVILAFAAALATASVAHGLSLRAVRRPVGSP